MEEILASIRRIIEDNDTDRPQPAGGTRLSDAAEIAPALEADAPADEIASFRAELHEPERAAPPSLPRAELPSAFGAAAAAPRIEPPVFQARPEPPALQPARPAAPAPGGHDILSASTSRKVTAAFGELSDAFAAQRRRSFDEMAEEMLKPMLREWLDDNLPTMVERLVREEIERLARGERG